MRYLFPLSPYNQQRQFEKPVWVYPAHLAMYATHLKNEGHDVYWGHTGEVDQIFLHALLPNDYKPWGKPDRIIENDTQIDVPFENLPFPNRIFTDAKNKRWQAYGNYKFHPATHMMASNLCWYGKCTFCIDTEKLKTEKRGLRSVAHVIEEIDDLIENGYKEVFDDSGTFPVGEWLEDFCEAMNEEVRATNNGKRLKRKDLIKIGCNMKPVKLDYKMMSNSGFRFILVGIESANQDTIHRIQKGQISSDVIPIIKSMSDAGLEPHGTFMTGYPWEEYEDEKRTIDLCHYLLRKGYLKTAQASVYSQPRTLPAQDSPGHTYLPRFYDAYKSPQFWLHKLKDLKKWEDFTYLIRGGQLVIEEKWRKFRGK
jgi:radical SAM superfamily enzyme YgiQ (UPF0313 family)